MGIKLAGRVAAMLLLTVSGPLFAQRSETLLEKDWKFSKGDFKQAAMPEFDDSRWQTVCVPHDWAIYGPFDIIDLASLPKDRFYICRSIRNRNDATLHTLPHWTWPGREGEVTPMFVHTSYPAAGLFANGKSRADARRATAR